MPWISTGETLDKFGRVSLNFVDSKPQFSVSKWNKTETCFWSLTMRWKGNNFHWWPRWLPCPSGGQRQCSMMVVWQPMTAVWWCGVCDSNMTAVWWCMTPYYSSVSAYPIMEYRHYKVAWLKTWKLPLLYLLYLSVFKFSVPISIIRDSW